MKQATIFKDWIVFYVSISYEKKEKPYLDNGLYQAIDLGVTHIVTAVNSWGKFLQIKNQRPDKYWQQKIKEDYNQRNITGTVFSVMKRLFGEAVTSRKTSM